MFSPCKKTRLFLTLFTCSTLHRQRNTHAAAYAQAGEPAVRIATHHLMQQRHQYAAP
jgi:hypothetical protein